MKRVKKKFWLLLFILILFLLFGCNSNPLEFTVLSNILKELPNFDDTVYIRYWMNRNRLKTQFLKIGLDSGNSIPASRLYHGNGVNWSDGTLHLGWYIGTLATEFYLLSIGRLPVYSGFPNEDIQTANDALKIVQQELYFALMALERLDKSAESSFSKPPICSYTHQDIPGFFIRDDVPSDFTIGNHSLYSSDFTIPFQKNLNSELENWKVNEKLIYNKEVSQDQIYHLLLGLALTKKFVNGVIIENIDLNSKAVELTVNLVQFLEKNNWIIKNPACDKKVERGYDARFLSLGTVRALKSITGIYANDHDKYGKLWETYRLLDNLNGLSSLLKGSSITDNQHMVMTLASIGNGWKETTLKDLMEMAIVNDWYIYPLLHYVLFGSNSLSEAYIPTLKNKIISILNSAPPDGPSSYSENENWHSDNRFLRTKNQQKGMGEDLSTGYNGLDFMLLYNLFLIANL